MNKLIFRLHRSWRSVVWLARYGFRASRRQSAIVLPLLAISFALQISLVGLIVMSSRIVSGDPISVFGLFHIRFGSPATAVAAGLLAITLLLLGSTYLTYLTSVRLRRAGRAVHFGALGDLSERFEDPTSYQNHDLVTINRLFHQASLQLGVAYEALLRLVQPM